MRRSLGVAFVLVFVLGLTLGVWGKDIPKITIGWTPPDITGVFKTATDFFEQATGQGVLSADSLHSGTEPPGKYLGF